MRRSIWSLIMISCTVAYAMMTLGGAQEKAAPARIVQVERGDVRRTIGLSGTLVYADEAYAFAAASGVISQICAVEDERLAAGDAIVRLDSAEQQTLMAAYAAANEYLTELAGRFGDAQLQTGASVVRAEKACTVRQILVQEGSPVSAGTPIARLSSNEQTIVCRVNEADTEELTEGMWAWLYSEEQELGYAYIASIKPAACDPLSGVQLYEVVLLPEKSIERPEGAALDAEVYIEGCDDVMTLPLEAVTERGTVWWVDDYGKCAEISAGLILYDEMLAWVSLPEGTKVAVGEFEEGQWVREAEE